MVRKRKQKKISPLGIAFVAIPVLIMCFVIIYPFALTISYSLSEFSGFGEPIFKGFENYYRLFTSNRFYESIKNNFIIASTVPIWMFVPLILALGLYNNRGRLLKTSRMVIFLPYALSMTITGIIFKALLEFNGPLNEILRSIGLDFLATNWLTNYKTAFPMIIMTVFWKDFGIYTVIYLAGLSNLDQELLDAAKVDGATWFQELRYIVIPQLNRIIVFITALVLIADFRSMFSYIYNMTRGGPGYSTFTIEFLLYSEGFKFLNMGYASAIGVVIFILIFTITSIQIRAMTRRD